VRRAEKFSPQYCRSLLAKTAADILILEIPKGLVVEFRRIAVFEGVDYKLRKGLP